MKIGVLFSAYNCAAHIDKVFEPWLELKDKLGLVLAATNGRYSLSPEDKNDAKGSHSLLKLIGKELDFLLHSSGTGELWTEEQGRNYMLNFALDRNVDLIWVVDADECYTKEQILKIIDFINENEHFDIYDIQFKNYVFKYPYWQDGFSKSVAFWVDRHEGVKDFYFDCYVRYKNGLTTDNNINKIVIPKNTAFVDHYSWLEADPRTSDKIINQNRKYNGPEGCRCIFKYNSENKLIFNKDFYDSRSLPMPVVYKTNKENDFIFDIIYKRDEHCFYVVNTKTNDNFDFNIYDDKGELLFTTNLTIAPDVNFFIKSQKPVVNEIFYRVVSKKNQEIIFDKEFHLNF